MEISGFTDAGRQRLPEGWKDMPAVVVDDPSIGIDPRVPWPAGREESVVRKYRTYMSLLDAWQANWSVGVVVSSSQHVAVEDNQIHSHSVGIELRDESSKLVVEDNQVRHTLFGLWGERRRGSAYSFAGSLIRGNEVRQTFREGIQLREGATDHYDQTLRDGNGVIVDYTPSGALVANNVIWRTMGSGITSTHSGHNVVVHNTVVECGHGTPSRTNGVGFRASFGDDIGNIVANNLVSMCSRGGLHFTYGNLSEQAYLDHNLFDLAEHVPIARDGDRLYPDLVSHRRSGFGRHSLAADPMFVDAAAGEFHLARGSPAIGAGTAAHSTAEDKDGVGRDRVAPTIGAYER